MADVTHIWNAVTKGQTITRAKFVQVVTNLNQERTRRGLATLTESTYAPAIGTVIYASVINNFITAINAMYSISWSQTPSHGSSILVASLSQLQSAITTMGNNCFSNCVNCSNATGGCSCNYGCTCNCYQWGCSCNCNYRTCKCQCNYYSSCVCNYSCTCNCNYCTCQCNYCPCNCNQNTCSCNTQG